MKIAVIGLGYVGSALAEFLYKNYDVAGYDTNPLKLCNKNFPTINKIDYRGFDVVFITTSTSFNEKTHELDTSSVNDVITEILSVNKNIDIFVKSTCPIGFSKKIIRLTKYKRIYYTPEFLSEQKALEELSNPSRIVIGTNNKKSKAVEFYISLFPKETPVVLTGTDEAEAIKLFSNTYLANRIAFFNELDSYAEINGLDSNDIIKGVCLDPRIGDYYNHPSYGYGGYCLPKDSKELKKQFKGIPQRVVGASISSNRIRKNHIVKMIRKKLRGVSHPIVGIYLLPYRNSPLVDIIYLLSNYDIAVMLYEPSIKEQFYLNAFVNNDLNDFKEKSNLILTESIDNNLNSVRSKLYVK